MGVGVRPVGADDAAWVRETLERTWGSVQVARRGELVDASRCAGFVAEVDGERAGLATFAVHGDEFELATLHALVENRGVGSALVDACLAAARDAGCRRLWLITTNDNTPAIRFYQRRGLDLRALHHDAVTAARRELKPAIPLVGRDGIPIRHELEFERLL
ncbi:GNAT family N-acetyltransferase [Geodermatophilus sp. YIM 151500]|uniref:GNAT family N-acetyltransferase n=1 Tax=Geodermatophilus sp. YIM 151500 TaxID=2984531 RepID=UPI0021E3F892|nr:GNAT family N-acetyltransferase [Geodermatophilus sp. YIM 151500]MCV2490742.1 GNAT family N-acetyltransferase [Geodermatophilus sp. YIM 151500]